MCSFGRSPATSSVPRARRSASLQAPAEHRPHRPQAGRVPAVEGLAEVVGELGHVLELGVDAGDVAQLEQAVQASLAGQERRLLVAEHDRQLEHLGGVGQAQVGPLGGEQGPVPTVQGHQQRLRVTDPARHRHGLLGQRRPAVDLAARVQLGGQPGQHLRPQRAVALGQRRQGLLEQADAGGLPGEPARQHHPAQPEPHDGSGAGDIAEGGVGQRLRRAQPTGDGGRLLEASARLPGVPGPPLHVAKAQQQLPVPVPAAVLQHRAAGEGRACSAWPRPHRRAAPRRGRRHGWRSRRRAPHPPAGPIG